MSRIPEEAFQTAGEPHEYDVTAGELAVLARSIRDMGLKRFLTAVVGRDSAKQMIRDAWVSLDRDDTET